MSEFNYPEIGSAVMYRDRRTGKHHKAFVVDINPLLGRVLFALATGEVGAEKCDIYITTGEFSLKPEVRPPLSVQSEKLWRETRMKELSRAINDYVSRGLGYGSCVYAWVHELERHLRRQAEESSRLESRDAGGQQVLDSTVERNPGA